MSATTVEHSPQQEAYVAGDCISDRYRLVRPLGSGGMGVVWLAYSTRLDVHVALKLLHGSLAGTRAVERMSREARAAARLGHEAMARVLDFGQTHLGHPFLVMELLHGESLRETLDRKGRMDAIRAVRTLVPIADALATAHDKGIVHRDVKPANVFIAHDDQGRLQPKLLDFGIAKLDEADLERKDPKLTEIGTVIGSPDYLSPEQAQGKYDIDGRSDVWAFSIMLYEAICGEAPFHAENRHALLYSIQTDEPKPTTDAGAGDEALWEIIHKGLAKDRSDRWPSMWQMGEALARWLLSHGVLDDICMHSLRSKWVEVNRPVDSGGARRNAESEHPRISDIGQSHGGRSETATRSFVGQTSTRTLKGKDNPLRSWILAGATISAVATGLALLASASSASAPASEAPAAPLGVAPANEGARLHTPKLASVPHPLPVSQAPTEDEASATRDQSSKAASAAPSSSSTPAIAKPPVSRAPRRARKPKATDFGF